MGCSPRKFSNTVTSLLKNSGRFKSKKQPWDFRVSTLQVSLPFRFLPLLLISASSLILSFTPGTFWPLFICQIFSLLHFKFLPNSLPSDFLDLGPHFPTLKLTHSEGEKQTASACGLQSPLKVQDMCTHAQWLGKMTPSNQNRNVSCSPKKKKKKRSLIIWDESRALELGYSSTRVDVRG